MIKTDNDLQEILSQELDKMSKEYGDRFDINKVNLAELERRTEISRSKLRKLKQNGFIVLGKRDNEVFGKNGNQERFYHLKIAK